MSDSPEKCLLTGYLVVDNDLPQFYTDTTFFIVGQNYMVNRSIELRDKLVFGFKKDFQIVGIYQDTLMRCIDGEYLPEHHFMLHGKLHVVKDENVAFIKLEDFDKLKPHVMT